ncbi:hypothetical protein J8L84_15105 [Alteromonas sp. MMG017]|uniref:hypothetical protein n=1 Tax=Alteromonas sp. MMG017 TaxID=2822692 RepID=UPI001B3A52E8|nr:hypothetical protein [Alteromonas sp. MMG017]MBQ4830604.1 hypothetical protein [Alteromonas sp. MMG017]
MKETETKLNKQISKHYIEHACSISSSGQVAKELGIEAPRVSEIKAGRRRLTADEAQVLKELYGTPSQSEGHWVVAELIDFDSLSKSLVDNSLVNQLVKVSEFVNSEEFIDGILSCIRVEESRIRGYERVQAVDISDKSKGTEQKNKRLVREYKLKLLNQMLSNAYFKNWCDTAVRLLTDGSVKKDFSFIDKLLYTKDVTTPTLVNGSVQRDIPNADFTNLIGLCEQIEPGFALTFDSYYPTEDIIRFIALGRLTTLLESQTFSHIVGAHAPFSFGKQLNIKPERLPKKEYVIVGKCVWDDDRLLRLREPMTEKSLLQIDATSSSSLILPEALELNASKYLSIRLFYTEQYKYVVEIQLYPDEIYISHRKILIDIKEKEKLFPQVLDILTFFNVEHHHTVNNIKAAVAKEGGYIPSAIYIE